MVYSTSKNSYHTEAKENLANTLVASDYKDPPTVNSPEYIVRRLTPTECARLQGFPDWWCADLGTDEPTDEELTFWKEVFEIHRKIIGSAVKPKSEKQIRAWLKIPTATLPSTSCGETVLLCRVFTLSFRGLCTVHS